jgi:hypothetical protein
MGPASAEGGDGSATARARQTRDRWHRGVAAHGEDHGLARLVDLLADSHTPLVRRATVAAYQRDWWTHKFTGASSRCSSLLTRFWLLQQSDPGG